MPIPRYIKHDDQLMTFDHLDTGCPVYMAFDKDLWIKVFPDGVQRTIKPLNHHMSAQVLKDLDAATERLLNFAKRCTK